MIKWIKIDVTFTSKYKPSFFTGSMLRGVIGHALKRVVCINPSYECEGCFSAKTCVYHKFYEQKNSFHNYRLGITLQPDKLDFSFYLFEDEISSLPYVLSALYKAFEEVGIGKEQEKVKIETMIIANSLVYDGSKFLSLESVIPQELEIDTYLKEVCLEFTMPLRIKQNNAFASKEIALHTLVNSVYQRYKKLKSEEQGSLNYRVQGEIDNSTLHFVDTQRYSNRQKSKMNMGGLMGTIDIKGLDKQSYIYLKIGEIIGAGKQTVFGLGSYTIKELR